MAHYIDTQWDSSGRPVTTNTFLHLRESENEKFEALCRNIIEQCIGQVIPGVVYILTGIVDIIGSGNHNISSGYVYVGDNGGAVFYSPSQIIPVTSDPVIANMLTSVIGGSNPDPIVYTDLSSHSPHVITSVLFSTGVSGTGTFNSGGFTPSTNNDLSNFVRINNLLNNVSTGNIVVSTGGGSGTVTGTIYYQKDVKNNSLLIEAVLTSSTPLDFNDYPGITYTIVGTLPVGFRPASKVMFDSFTDLTSYVELNFGGTIYLERFEVQISTGGIIKIRFIKPDAGVASYSVEFKQLISLY